MGRKLLYKKVRARPLGMMASSRRANNNEGLTDSVNNVRITTMTLHSTLFNLHLLRFTLHDDHKKAAHIIYYYYFFVAFPVAAILFLRR